MKVFLAALFLTLGLASAPATADEAAAKGVIAAQIEAFKGDDFETAFSYAAPNIRDMFQTSDNFGLMVRRGYPMVWQPGTVEYLGGETNGPFWEQEVLITDGFGRLHVLEYSLIETEAGWKIAAVQLLRAPEVGA